MRDIDKYDHFYADEVFNLGKKLIADAENGGNIRMFDQVNIRTESIRSIDYNNDWFNIKVDMNILYMDYLMNKDSGKVVSGDDSNRSPHAYTVTFSKSRTAKEQGIVKTCPTCGASLNPNSNGICEYCHTVYNQEDHDWVLSKIDGLR